jgi:hypothetical protein
VQQALMMEHRPSEKKGGNNGSKPPNSNLTLFLPQNDDAFDELCERFVLAQNMDPHYDVYNKTKPVVFGREDALASYEEVLATHGEFLIEQLKQHMFHKTFEGFQNICFVLYISLSLSLSFSVYHLLIPITVMTASI